MRSYMPDPEVKQLTAEVARLRAENDHLKSLVARHREPVAVFVPKAAAPKAKATGTTKRKAVHSGRASHIA